MDMSLLRRSAWDAVLSIPTGTISLLALVLPTNWETNPYCAAGGASFIRLQRHREFVTPSGPILSTRELHRERRSRDGQPLRRMGSVQLPVEPCKDLATRLPQTPYR